MAGVKSFAVVSLDLDRPEAEKQLGAALVAIVQTANVNNPDPERARRTAVSDISDDIREAEVLAASDARVIGVEED